MDLFRKADKDGNGKISLKLAQDIFASLGMDMGLDDYRRVLTCEVDAYLDAVTWGLHEQVVKLAFSILDANNDGFVCMNDLAKMLPRICPPDKRDRLDTRKATLEELVGAASEGGDRMSLGQFRTWMENEDLPDEWRYKDRTEVLLDSRATLQTAPKSTAALPPSLSCLRRPFVNFPDDECVPEMIRRVSVDEVVRSEYEALCTSLKTSMEKLKKEEMLSLKEGQSVDEMFKDFLAKTAFEDDQNCFRSVKAAKEMIDRWWPTVKSALTSDVLDVVGGMGQTEWDVSCLPRRVAKALLIYRTEVAARKTRQHIKEARAVLKETQEFIDASWALFPPADHGRVEAEARKHSPLPSLSGPQPRQGQFRSRTQSEPASDLQTAERDQKSTFGSSTRSKKLNSKAERQPSQRYEDGPAKLAATSEDAGLGEVRGVSHPKRHTVPHTGPAGKLSSDKDRNAASGAAPPPLLRKPLTKSVSDPGRLIGKRQGQSLPSLQTVEEKWTTDVSSQIEHPWTQREDAGLGEVSGVSHKRHTLPHTGLAGKSSIDKDRNLATGAEMQASLQNPLTKSVSHPAGLTGNRQGQSQSSLKKTQEKSTMDVSSQVKHPRTQPEDAGLGEVRDVSNKRRHTVPHTGPAGKSSSDQDRNLASGVTMPTSLQKPLTKSMSDSGRLVGNRQGQSLPSLQRVQEKPTTGVFSQTEHSPTQPKTVKKDLVEDSFRSDDAEVAHSLHRTSDQKSQKQLREVIDKGTEVSEQPRSIKRHKKQLPSPAQQSSRRVSFPLSRRKSPDERPQTGKHSRRYTEPAIQRRSPGPPGVLHSMSPALIRAGQRGGPKYGTVSKERQSASPAAKLDVPASEQDKAVSATGGRLHFPPIAKGTGAAPEKKDGRWDRISKAFTEKDKKEERSVAKVSKKVERWLETTDEKRDTRGKAVTAKERVEHRQATPQPRSAKSYSGRSLGRGRHGVIPETAEK